MRRHRTNADSVEKYLNNVLYLGKTWNCGKSGSISVKMQLNKAVLLLDEADVFLEERSLSDLERNSLVSGTSTNTSPQ